jgi:polyhydroxyalkanoate synthesis regulator phasin
MADDRPMWRQGFDAVEQGVAPLLEDLMKNDQFQVAVGLVTQAQKALQTRAERSMRRALHLWNLPAGSDVTRILNEIGKLQREVRELSKQVEAERGVANGAAGRGAGSGRARAAES